ncbi:MAG TPA: gluconolaconase, partial [Saprospiraceae bacterium]|nr:gluconolaconase [Saprospiraceae bacterium]
MTFNVVKKSMYAIVIFGFLVSFLQCKTEPKYEWSAVNDKLIKEHNLTVREITGLPEQVIASNLEAAQVKNIQSLPDVKLGEGASAKLFWGTGTMVAVIQLDSNATIAEETLPADRFLFVLKGSVDQLIDGKMTTLIALDREAPDGSHSGTPKTEFVYLEKGSKSALKAGAQGAKLLEIYSPFRLDYLQKAGITELPTEFADITNPMAANVETNKVYDLYDFHLTELAKGAYSRLISGKNTQLSFISMEPNSTFPHHIHPEEQMMLVMRGGCEEILLDGKQKMEVDDVVRIPGNFVHGAEIGDLGCDALDIFWPARPDYLEKEKSRLQTLNAIIPAGSKPQLIVDGSKTKPSLTFSEGPKW